MATRSFLVVTLFATIFGIGMAELARQSLHRDLLRRRSRRAGSQPLSLARARSML